MYLTNGWIDFLRNICSYVTYEPNQMANNFCNNNSLSEAWRHFNSNIKRFSWIRLNGNNKSRIDLWLGSILVTHQLQYLKAADQIVVLKEVCLLKMHILFLNIWGWVLCIPILSCLFIKGKRLLVAHQNESKQMKYDTL